jgi:Tfp pilus assembly protein PilX
MMTTPIVHSRSERGIALVVVLLLMAVLSGLATGFAMNGQVESSMAHNEVYYAGARAAAEAGMNRAIEAIRYNTDANLLLGQDGLADPAVAANAGVNADNGDVGFLFTAAPTVSPYALDAAGQYTYTVQVFDDDDPRLYSAALTPAQLAAMQGTAGIAENGSGQNDTNSQLILRATGFGPSGTVVTLARVLLSTAEVAVPPPSLNPAILVNGDLNIGGNINVLGKAGSVHANGDLAVDGASATVSINATASGDFTAKSKNFNAGGAEGGGYASITVPDIHASDYTHLAGFTLHDDGSMTKTDAFGVVTACVIECVGWTRVGTTWTIGSNVAPTGTFFVEGAVKISGSPGSVASPISMSVIATGSIDISGSPKFSPGLSPTGLDHKYQFVTDGDLKIGGAAGMVDPDVEGQILVREQIDIHGNPKFRGRIMVGDADDVFSDVTTNTIPGNPTFTYDGTLDALPSDAGAPVYTNNFSGWIEQ